MNSVFLLNPLNKGKVKKAKKVAKKVKKVKKAVKKVVKKVKTVKRVKRVKRVARKVTRKAVRKVTKKLNRRVRKMARRKKYNFSKAIGTKHRISVRKVKKGYRIGKSKLLVRSRGKILNPFKMSAVTDTLIQAGFIVAGMIGATIIPNKVIPAQYTTGKYAKPMAQIGTGIVLYYLVKKFTKKTKIAEELLLGSVIAVVKEMVDTYVVPKLNAGTTVNGLKINGLKLGNANAQKPMINPANIRPNMSAPVSSLSGVSQTRSVGTRRV